MREEDVRALYGGQYAKRFNQIWHDSEKWKAEAAHDYSTLSGLITEDTRWLDVGCGTGWMLSEFPDTVRAGVDISPDMLTEAREANPSALFLREGDLPGRRARVARRVGPRDLQWRAVVVPGHDGGDPPGGPEPRQLDGP